MNFVQFTNNYSKAQKYWSPCSIPQPHLKLLTSPFLFWNNLEAWSTSPTPTAPKEALTSDPCTFLTTELFPSREIYVLPLGEILENMKPDPNSQAQNLWVWRTVPSQSTWLHTSAVPLLKYHIQMLLYPGLLKEKVHFSWGWIPLNTFYWA